MLKQSQSMSDQGRNRPEHTQLKSFFIPARRGVEIEQLRTMARQCRIDAFSSVFFSGLIVFGLSGAFPTIQAGNIHAIYLWLGAMALLSPLMYWLGTRFLTELPSRMRARMGQWRLRLLGLYSLNACLWGSLIWVANNEQSLANQAFLVMVYVGLTGVYAVHVSAHMLVYTSVIVILYTGLLSGLAVQGGDLAAPLLVIMPIFGLFSLLLGHDNNRHLTNSITRERDQRRLVRELELARTRAVEANRAKSSFLAMMSHELRTPLNAIIGFADMMRSKTFGSINEPRYAGYVEDIHGSGEHLLKLLNELLDMSRIDAGNTDLDENELDMVELVTGCLHWMGEKAQSKAIDLRLITPLTSARITGDSMRIKQIVLNLVSNGIKYTREGGQVHADLTLNDRGELIMGIADTGVGMDEEDLARIFEPFTQLGTRTLNAHEGVGLGLAITKRLVHLHGGSIAVQSKKDQGTRIDVRFPVERLVHVEQKATEQHGGEPMLGQAAPA